jgi:hypothetical protein
LAAKRTRPILFLTATLLTGGASAVPPEPTPLGLAAVPSPITEPEPEPAGNALPPARFPDEFRSVTGRHNNAAHPHWGEVGTAFLRQTPVDYADGRGAPAGASRPGARLVSNLCFLQRQPRPAAARATSFLWQWGLLLDHDLDLAPVAAPLAPFPIPVPEGDPYFDPEGLGDRVIPFSRSAFQMVEGVRQQANIVSAYIDASAVYGSDPRRARRLKTHDGSGRLVTGEGDLLPFNRWGLPNSPTSSPAFFVAGDVRANENVGLTTLHVVFLREHNHWADLFREADPTLSGDETYEWARSVVAAEFQAITYREFLPVLLGPQALPPYAGYDPLVDAGISNEFATAAFRVGHTMVPSWLLELDRHLQPIHAEPLAIRDAFFAPQPILDDGIEPLLRGLFVQPAEEVDLEMVDEIRNFLFGPPGAGGLDLAALDIQRGRDHGLPSLNQTRMAYGLEPHRSFERLTPDRRARSALRKAYGSIDEVDLVVGGLAEPHLRGAMVGETFFTILVDQFRRLRDGDRFWYESYLPPDLVRLVNRRTLGRLVRSHTAIRHELPLRLFQRR